MKKRADKRRGAAMLVVLLVLTMTTATATFAIHATSVEIRAAGFARQAQQAEHIAEGGALAGIAYVDMLKANGSLVALLRTDVAANTPSSPGEATVSRETNLIRVQLDDFTSTTPGVNGPPIETDLERTPSLGPRTAYVPSFMVDGTDVYTVFRDQAGEDLSGRGTRFYRMSLTSRGTLAPASDYRASGDDRDYHESAQRARAYVEVGPFWAGGH
jgi:hypothetical protein